MWARSSSILSKRSYRGWYKKRRGPLLPVNGCGRRPATGMAEIKFGTDGWRGVIADDYTFDNVRRVANAIAAYVLKREDAARGVMIGYDTRFGSPRFARLAAEVIAGAGVPVKLANDYTPTPAVS